MFISTLNDKNSTTNDTQSIINKIEEKSIEFEQYEVYLYSRNGTYICKTKNKNIWLNDDIDDDDEDEDEENNIENNDEIIRNSNNSNNLNNKIHKNNKNNIDIDSIISRIIKGICVSDFKKTKINEGIHYNTILFNRLKISIINIPITNLIALGIFSQETKSSIIRIFLLNMIISFINYTGDKSEFFKLKKNNDMDSINKMNDLNFKNYLYSKIYDTFLSIPIQMHFSHIIKKVFKRSNLYIKDIFYKNYYLIDLYNDKTILSLETLHDKNNKKDPVLKTSDQKFLWDELLFHCHNLKNDYIKKNNMTFNGIDYQNFFVKVEYRATYPRRNYIVKFLPLLNGMCIIHEYIQLKISTFEANEKKKYNEKNIIYGYDAYDNIFRNSDNRYFENEHFLLKQVHYFIIESLFCSNSSISYFFVLTRKPKIYFSEDILVIIDKEVNDYLKENNNNNNSSNMNEIINRIINTLYEEYIQINNNEKIVPKTSNLITDKRNKNDLIIKEIESLNKNKSLELTKNETLIFLFNSIQYNKNINPNDITIDLNDERISLLRVTQNENDEFPSPRRSKLNKDTNRPNSIRLSDLLAEKPFNKPQKEKEKEKTQKYQVSPTKFPQDSEIPEEPYIDTEKPLKEEDKYNDSYYNEKSYSYNQNNIINTNTNNNDIVYDNKNDYNDSNYQDDNNITNKEYNINNINNESENKKISNYEYESNNKENMNFSQYPPDNDENINSNDYDNEGINNNKEFIDDNENIDQSIKLGSSKQKLKKSYNFNVSEYNNDENTK